MASEAVLAYNFTLGLLAFFAPCGFPMLPAYIAYYLPRAVGAPEPLARRIARGIGGGLIAGAGAFAVLLLIGGLAIVIGAPFKSRVALLELFGAMILIALGVSMLLGRGISLKFAVRPSEAKSALGLAGFGALYAATASACVAPVLIGVLFPAFAAPTLLDGFVQVGAYGAGLAATLVIVTVLITASQDKLVPIMRKIVPHVEKVSGTLLIAAGLYLAWYFAAVEFGWPAPPSISLG